MRTLFLILRSIRGSFLSFSLSSFSAFCRLFWSPPSKDLCRLKQFPSPVPPSPPLSSELRLFVTFESFFSSASFPLPSLLICSLDFDFSISLLVSPVVDTVSVNI